MILDRQRLVNMCDVLATACGNKHMDVSNYVKFVVDKANGGLYLSSTDFTTFIVIDYGDISMVNTNDVVDEFLVPLEKLHELIRNSTTESVVIKCDNKAIEIRTNGTYKFGRYTSESDFPVIDFTNDVVAQWGVGQLIEDWNKGSGAVTKDVTKREYQGVNFDGNWCSTDGKRMAVVGVDSSYEGDSFVVSTEFGNVVKHCQGRVNVGKSADGRFIVVTSEDIGLVAAIRALDTGFVDYRMLVDNRTSECSVIVEKDVLTGALARINILTDKIFKIIKLELLVGSAGAKLQISMENNGAGKETLGVVDFKAEGTGTVVANSYNIDQVLEGLQLATESDQVELNFQEDGKMWFQDGNFMYVVSKLIT